MIMESEFNFLQVIAGKTYFARVTVAASSEVESIQISPKAGSQNPNASRRWLEAARMGAERARQAHSERGGPNLGLTIMSVLGTDVDTTDNSVEVAAFCSAWKALGHPEAELKLEFHQDWQVKVK